MRGCKARGARRIASDQASGSDNRVHPCGRPRGKQMMFMASEAMIFTAYIHSTSLSSPQLSDLPTDLAHREARVTIVTPNCNSMRVLRSWSMFCTSRCRSTSAIRHRALPPQQTPTYGRSRECRLPRHVGAVHARLHVHEVHDSQGLDKPAVARCESCRMSPHRGASVTVCRKLRCVHPQPRRLMACQNT